ncbi:ABC transporter substrate-binding protein [bacterium]|nr:ABC transporter substrate-binding protein [bacterium]
MKRLSIGFILILLAFSFSGCANEQADTENPVVTMLVDDIGSPDPSEEPGVEIVEDPDYPVNLSGETYTLLLIGSDEIPLDGPFQSVQVGVRDAVAYLNRQDGVFGAEIELIVRSVAISDEQAEDQILDLVFEVAPQFVLLAVPVTETLHEKLNGQSVPVLYYGVGGERLPQVASGRDNLFWLTPYPDEQMAFVFEALRSNWKSISPASTYPELIGAYLTWEEAYGGQAFSAELERYFIDRGFQIAVQKPFSVSPNTNVTNAILASLSSSVGVIYTDTFSFGPTVIANDIASLGMADFFLLAGSVWGADGFDVAYLWESSFVGKWYVPRYMVWWDDTENPAIKLAHRIGNYSGRASDELDFGYLLGIGSVDIATHVIRTAVRETNRGDLSGREVYLHLSKLKNYSVLDGLFTVDYTNSNRAPDMLQLWCYSDGDWTAVGEMEKVPDLAGE